MLTELEAPSSARHRQLVRRVWTTLVLALCWSVLSSPLWAQGVVTRVSVGSGGTEGDDRSEGAALSADGRFVAFRSYATNLVAADTNGVADIFVHDRLTATTTRVSVGPGGEQANAASWGAALSADGRLIAFESDATNLVPGDDNAARDVFVHDRQTGLTTRVSVGSGGGQANDGSWAAALSADGRFVAFESDATNLVPGDDNAARDVFVHDRQTGLTTRVSVGVAGAQADDASYTPVLSADGRFVAFSSYATNLVVEADSNGQSDVFVHDCLTAATTRLSGAADSVESWGPSISADGRFVAFTWLPLDGYSLEVVLVVDRLTGATTFIGGEGDWNGREARRPSISADGRHVAYAYADFHWNGEWTYASDGLMVQDIETAATTLAVNGVADTWVVAMSADGRFVAFESEVDSLVQGDTNLSRDVFVRDGTALGKSVPANGATAQPIDISLSWLSAWLPASGATTHEYCYDTIDNGACDSSWIDARYGTTIHVSPGTTYFWQVRSGTIYADGGTWWSFTTGSMPGAFGKSAPANGVTGASASLSLTWSPSAGATSYWYCYDLTNDGSCYGNWTLSSGTTASITVNPATTYYWQVLALNAVGTVSADGGAWWSFRTAPTAPPGNFTTTSPPNGSTGVPVSPSLFWSPSTGMDGYEYCVDTVNNNTCDAAWVSTGTWTATTVNSLTYATTYYWLVRAMNSLGTTYANDGVWRSFTTVPAPTRIIGLSGNLVFGDVTVNTTATRTLTVSNTGNATLTVNGISYPAGFSGAWSGTIAAGGSQTITVTFAPRAATSYGGTVTVNADQTAGVTTVAISGTGVTATRRNVALATYGARAVASSSYSDRYLPNGAIDGDRKGLNWGNGGGWNDATVDDYPDWLEVDFSGSQTIDRIDVFTVQDNWPSPVDPTPTMTTAAWGLRSFEVHYWDGLAWQAVPGGTVTGSTLAWRAFVFAAVTTTKIRVFVTESAAGYSRITEIEAWTPVGPAPVNVALGANGARAAASSTYSASYLPSGAIDGDRQGLGWGSGGGWNDGTVDDYPDWLEVHFAGAQPIDEIDVFTVQNAWWQPVEPTVSLPAGSWGIADFEVQYWDGTAWQVVSGGAVKGNTLAWRQFSFSEISTTKIRVYVTGAASSYSRIVEVEAWSRSPSLPAPTRANVALTANGATAISSSTYSSSYSAAGATDGDRMGLGWGNAGGWNDATAGSFPDWLEVSFAGAQTITEVDVFTVQDHWWAPVEPTPTLTAAQWSLRDFEVQYWTGTAWQTVPGATVTGNTLAWRQFTFAPITTTKIRVWVDDAAAEYSRVVEVEAWNPSAVLPLRPRTNVALASNLATVRASSTYSSSYLADAVIDGDRQGAGWGAGGGWNDATLATYPDWVEVNFAGAQRIDEIDVFTLHDDWPNPLDVTPALTAITWGVRAFEVQYWNGAAWQVVPSGSVTGNTFAWRRFSFEPITTTKIRVVVTEAPDYARIVEVEAYAR